MSGLDVAAGILAVLQATGTILGYMKDVRDAPIEQIRLHAELANVQCLLDPLHARLKDLAQDAALTTIRVLDGKSGPIAQFRSITDELLVKLQPTSKAGEIVRKLKWPFTRNSALEILSRIERLKTVFLLALENDHIAISKILRDDVRRLQHDITSTQQSVAKLDKAQRIHHQQTRDHAAAFETSEDDERKYKIIKWLAAPDPSINYNTAISKRQPDTGKWFMQSPVFERWKITANNPLIWLDGKPGCGKTILSASIIQHTIDYCKSVPGSVLAYFFFDFNDQFKQTITGLLSSLIVQLASASRGLPACLSTLYSQQEEGTRTPSVDVLSTVLVKLSRNFHCLFFIIDALDECTTREAFLSWIRGTLSSIENIHGLVLSRREYDIENELSHLIYEDSEHRRRISIDDANVDADIRLYVRVQLANDVKLKKWSNHKSIRDQIEQNLMQKANGMFRWAFCQLDALRKCIMKRDIDRVLQGLPKTLDETYERILMDIERGEYAELALRALTWLCFSDAPIPMDHMIDILAIDTEEPFEFDAQQRLQDPYDILIICSSLVSIIRPETTEQKRRRQYLQDHEETNPDRLIVSLKDKLKLAHFSVKEFLTSERLKGRFAMTPGPGYEMIALDSLRYLSQFRNDQMEGDEFRNKALVSPLANILARRCWTFVKLAENHKHSNRIAALVLEIMASPKLHLSMMVIERFGFSMFWFDDKKQARQRLKMLEQDSTQLILAAMRNMPHIVEHFLEKGVDANAVVAMESWMLRDYNDQRDNAGPSCINALTIACKRGNLEVVELLLKYSVNINQRIPGYGSAIVAAAAFWHFDVVKCLVQNGADVNAAPTNIETNHKDLTERTALHHAVQEYQTQMVQYLTKRGANCVGAIRELTTSKKLIEASAITIIEEVVSHGCQIDEKDYKGATLLHKAVRDNENIVVNYLLDRGMDIEIRDLDGRTALLVALTRIVQPQDSPMLSMASLLINRNADIHARDKTGATVLHCMCHLMSVYSCFNWGGDDDPTELLRLLLERGVEVNAQDHRGWTPLFHFSSAHLNNTTIQIAMPLLLSHGADINATTTAGDTPLLQACASGSEDGVRILLHHGADVNTTTNEGDTPLLRACHRDHVDIVRMLLNHGATVNISNREGYTPLLRACSHYSIEIIQSLLDHGANVNATSNWGETPLLQACGSLSFMSLRRLIEVSRLAVNRDIGAPLPAKLGYLSTAEEAQLVQNCKSWIATCKRLFDLGANVNARTSEGETPLLRLCGSALITDSRESHYLYGATAHALTELLLDRGADIYARDKNGQSALQMVQNQIATPSHWWRQEAILRIEAAEQMLLKHGAVNIPWEPRRNSWPFVKVDSMDIHIKAYNRSKNVPEHSTAGDGGKNRDTGRRRYSF